MIEPSAIAIITAVMVPVLAGLLYIIRAEIRRNTKTTDDTHAQVIPNHGTSLRDAIDRMERQLAEVHIDVRQTRSDLANHIDFHLKEKR
jgi:uncharacterized membrane protein